MMPIGLSTGHNTLNHRLSLLILCDQSMLSVTTMDQDTSLYFLGSGSATILYTEELLQNSSS